MKEMLLNLMFAIQLSVHTGLNGKKPCLVQPLVEAGCHFERGFASTAHPMSRQSVLEKNLKTPNATLKNVHFGLLGQINRSVRQLVAEEKSKDLENV